MGSKRILYLSDINSVHTRRWIMGMREFGYEIKLFSLALEKDDWSEKNKITSHCFGVKQSKIRSGSTFKKLAYFKASKELKEVVKEFNPEIVHAHYATSYGSLMRKLNHPKSVLSVWGSDVYDFPNKSVVHKLFLKRILNFPSLICSTSGAMAKQAQKFTKNKIEVVPFGVDTRLFKPATFRRKLKVLGTVKSLEHVYGIDKLINVFAAYTEKFNSDLELHIYGSGSLEEEYKKQVDNLNLKNRVKFWGRVEGENLVKAFQSIDLFLALSREESFGVAVLEAEACGVPVICTNVGGLPEVVEPENGILLSGTNVLQEGLDAINKFENLTYLENAGKTARDFVVGHYSDKISFEKMKHIYESI